MSERLYQINPALRVQEFDDAALTTRWLYELDDVRGRVQRLLVSAPMHHLLTAYARPRALAWTKSELQAEGWRESDGPALQALIRERCLPCRLLIPCGGDASVRRNAPEQPPRPTYMSLMVPVLGAATVNRAARHLQHLFAPVLMIPGAVAVLVALVALMQALSSEGRFAAASSADVLRALALGIVGVVVHELGHAAAAWRSGARRVSIGIGWYVCFPVAYADLSETWRMSRRERALIDIAGVYLQGLWIAGLMFWHSVSGHAALLVAALAGAISILWNMNPFLRMDGYWLASDLLGIANLREAARSSLAASWNRLRRRPVMAGRIRFGPRTTTALLGYGVLSTAFFAWMVVAAVDHFGEAALEALPRLAQDLRTSAWSRIGIADFWVLIGSFLWQVFMVVVLGRFLQVTAKRWWRRWSRGEPPA